MPTADLSGRQPAMAQLDSRASATTTPATEQTTVRERGGAEIPPPASAAEMAALRARLREVEAALGLPLRPGQPTPPDLPDLRRRVAALERRHGLVPGLIPLPGRDETAAPARATVVTSEPAGRSESWRARGRAALAAAALVAALAWLLHPLPGGPGYFRAAAPTAQAAGGTAAAAQAPVAVLAGEVPARADARAPSALQALVAPPAGNAASAAGPCPGRDLALTGACGPIDRGATPLRDAGRDGDPR